MQPPPRKGNYVKFLKNLHSEQINKLALKNQHECELLEDIRTYTIKRSAIERSYSEALLKISSGYLNKKIPNIPDIKIEGGDEKWNMWSVWRTVLEENEKLSRARLAAVEVFQQNITDDAKILRQHKLQTAKRCLDQLAMVQKELQTCVQDVDKTKKLYFDEEHCAHDVRDKARDIEEKLKKKKGSFFQSITSLQKNSAKFSSKREQLEEKSTGARNDYLLDLAAANAHQNRYFVVDLQLCMSTMEAGVYEKVAEYLTLMGRTELLTCMAMQNSFSTIRDQAKQLTREYNLQCCYLYYPVLKQHIQYEFEACDDDPVETVTAEHDSAAATLSKEARRWANKIARENNNVRESVRKMQIYNALREAGQRVDPNDQNGPDLETKIEDLKQGIRKSETAKTKAEARLEALREGGVNVDEWLQEAESLNVQDIQRSASSLSDHPSSDSFYDSDFAEGENVVVTPATGTAADGAASKTHHDEEEDRYDSPEVDAALEQERHRIEQLTAGWDDPTQVDWGMVDEEDATHDAHNESSVPLLKCTALYSYTAQNPDELSIVENEQLEVVGEGDGDGWLRARNYKGEEGYVPHNYLDVEREQSATTPGLVNQISFSSVDYTVDNNEEGGSIAPSETTNQSPEQVSVISPPQQKQPPDPSTATAIAHAVPPPAYCIALYDYDGESGEELSFEEGQIIRVISKCAHSIDDGWWQGDLEGRIGNFPSLVVEECDEFGEPLTGEFDETPPQSAPPVFTPPEAPEDAILDDGGEESFDDFHPDELLDEEGGEGDEGGDGRFSMTMSRDQQQQYGSQFGGRPPPAIDVPCVEIVVNEDDGGGDGGDAQLGDDGAGGDFGLGVAQIVITAATPMIEEAEHPFPPLESVNEEEEEEDEEAEPVIVEVIEKIEEEEGEEEEEEKEEKNRPRPLVTGGGSSSTGSDGDTGPSTAENSVSHQVPPPQEPPKQVVGGRASIPDELEPHQLARLQDLKESNA